MDLVTILPTHFIPYAVVHLSSAPDLPGTCHYLGSLLFLSLGQQLEYGSTHVRLLVAKGWEPTFLIGAFGFSEELSTEVGFDFLTMV